MPKGPNHEHKIVEILDDILQDHTRFLQLIGHLDKIQSASGDIVEQANKIKKLLDDTESWLNERVSEVEPAYPTEEDEHAQNPGVAV